eukprot:9656825-Ditylum_brightwellii.AAC.1
MADNNLSYYVDQREHKTRHCIQNIIIKGKHQLIQQINAFLYVTTGFCFDITKSGNKTDLGYNNLKVEYLIYNGKSANDGKGPAIVCAKFVKGTKNSNKMMFIKKEEGFNQKICGKKTGDEAINEALEKRQKTYQNLNKLKGAKKLQDEEEADADNEMMKAVKDTTCKKANNGLETTCKKTNECCKYKIRGKDTFISQIGSDVLEDLQGCTKASKAT